MPLRPVRFPRVRRLLPALGLALLLAPRIARADDRVPDVPSKDLPVCGTCAPIETSDVTRVLVGALGFFRVDGSPDVLDEAGLAALLAQRSAASQGAPGGGAGSYSHHSVWVTSSAAQPFLSFWQVVNACLKARIFRVGLEVKPSEEGPAGFGFPLFLPGQPAPGDASAPKTKATRLAVKLDRVEGTSSNPRRLYALAKQMSERYAPVVAQVSLDTGLAVQHVVTCLDLLYRGGCAGVKLSVRSPLVGRGSTRYEGPDPTKNQPGTTEASEKNIPTRLLITALKDRVLGASEPMVDLTPIAPRKAAWGDEGANAPGALALELQDPPLSELASKPEPQDEPLPSYAGRREGAPTTALVAADKAVADWSASLGKSLTEALNHVWTLTPHFVTRLRDKQRFESIINPLVAMFPSAQRVVPSTLRLDVYLVKGVNVVGKAETTLHVAGQGLSFIFARWTVEQIPANLDLPPAITDPFAAGVPGHIRVWLEGAFDSVYRQGPAGLVLAPDNEVLAQLPAIAQEGSRKALAARGGDLETLAGWLKATEYDRLLIVPRVGTAAVHAQGQVVGILQFGLESEEKTLRLSNLTGRAAPK